MISNKPYIEFFMCKHNIFYFMEKYLNLELRGYQIDILKKYIEHEKNNTIPNIVGHREMGLTLINCVYSIWNMIFHNKNVLMFEPSNYEAVSTISLCSKLLTTCQINCDGFSFFKINRTTLYSIDLENRSSIGTHSVVSGERCRGKDIDIIVYSDINYNLEGYEGYLETINYGRTAILAFSSLNPVCEFDSIGTVYRYPWFCNPERTFIWYEETLNIFDSTVFNLSYGAFRG